MDLALFNGDFLCDSRGFPIEISGTDELLQQAILRLSIKKGSFAYDRNLGSKLYKLNPLEENLKSKAASLIKEALNDMENVSLDDVSVISENNSLILNISLSINGEQKDVVINV